MKKLEEFTNIMESSNTDKVLILTDHYQIVGQVYDCEKCNKEFYINLVDASLCMLNDIYEAKTCDKYSSSHYDWLHINLDKIIAFSFIN